MRPKSYIQERRDTKLQTKVHRLRPGVVPEWAKQDPAQTQKKQEPLVTGLTADSAAVIIDTSKGFKESEIQRQVLGELDSDSQDDREDAPQVVRDGSESVEEGPNAVISDDEQIVPQAESDDESEDSESSGHRVDLEKCRPIFLKKEDRELLFESEAKAAQEALKDQEIAGRIEEGKKQQVEAMIVRAVEQPEEQQVALNYDSDNMLPFSDHEDNDQAYCESELAQELWKARELQRVLRERQQWKEVEDERREVERRRKLTEE